eukprot:1151036-Pelagomonas_calceolata.AAC.1
MSVFLSVRALELQPMTIHVFCCLHTEDKASFLVSLAVPLQSARALHDHVHTPDFTSSATSFSFLLYPHVHSNVSARAWQSTMYRPFIASHPHISRMECMANCGTPTSTVRHPSEEAKIGPIVLPQGMSGCRAGGPPARKTTSIEHDQLTQQRYRSPVPGRQAVTLLEEMNTGKLKIPN